jgi:hypothetical protein
VGDEIKENEMGGLCSYDKWVQILVWKSRPKPKKSSVTSRHKFNFNIKTRNLNLQYKARQSRLFLIDLGYAFENIVICLRVHKRQDISAWLILKEYSASYNWLLKYYHFYEQEEVSFA